MTSIDYATWVLAVFTIILAGATIWYAIETHEMNRSSEKNQALLQEQNKIMDSHNQSLREQTNVQHDLVGVLTGLSQKMVFIENAITSLPYDADEMKTKKESAEHLRRLHRTNKTT